MGKSASTEDMLKPWKPSPLLTPELNKLPLPQPISRPNTTRMLAEEPHASRMPKASEPILVKERKLAAVRPTSTTEMEPGEPSRSAVPEPKGATPSGPSS